MTDIETRDTADTQALRQILEVTRKLAAPFDLDTMLAEVVNAAREVLRAERGIAAHEATLKIFSQIDAELAEMFGADRLERLRADLLALEQVAGMAADRVIFPPRVVRGIYQRTRGIPRLINVLCDRILLGAYGRNKSRADMSMLRQAAREVLHKIAERKDNP